jgi:hypothetical protein
MNCPKCGKENPDDTQVCQFCNASITETSEPKQPVTFRVSKLAIFALLLGISSVLIFFPLFSFLLEVLVRVIGRVVLFFPLLPIILGFISLIQIEKSGGKITGRAFAITAILIPIFAAIIPFWFIALRRPRSVAYRPVCGTNLSGIGKAMLIYSNDYDDELPRAGGRDSIWGNSIPDWTADSRSGAYGLNPDGSGGQATISSSLYLLVKYAEIEPKHFICNKEKGVKEFKSSAYLKGEREVIDLWDFGPEPRKHCSYSYHMPYGLYALTLSSEPGMAVAADSNPWIKAPAAKPKKFAKFDPDGDRKAIDAGNCIWHKADGQNVLFMDCHVGFEKISFCGINSDNIYTYWDGQDIRRGAIPNIKSQPADRLDSMLVNDLP